MFLKNCMKNCYRNNNNILNGINVNDKCYMDIKNCDKIKIRKEIMKFCFNKVRVFMDKTLLRDLSINLFV